jgi:outer membrane protein assembly factor BamB
MHVRLKIGPVLIPTFAMPRSIAFWMHFVRSALILLGITVASAENWPCWRGPQHNGISQETGWNVSWPVAGPPIAWRASVGIGFSSVVVSDNRLYTMGNEDNQDTVRCLDATTGTTLWSHSYEADLGDKFFEGGPTSTPTVHGDSVFTLSRWGHLTRLDRITGQVRWSTNVAQETGTRIPGWGFAGSPRIHDQKLLLNVGESGMAIDPATGSILWKSANRDAGYSTPVTFKLQDRWVMALGSGKSFLAVDVETGTELWQQRWLTRYGVNSADPIVAGNQMFISSGYGKGAALLEMNASGVNVVWQNRDMRNQLNSCVLLDGHLFGFDGDAGVSSSLRCLSWKTGEVLWTDETIATGGLMAAGNRLIVLSDQGELMVAEASREHFPPLARARVLQGKCWTTPTLANGRIYCRNAVGDLVCVDVRPTAPASSQVDQTP